MTIAVIGLGLIGGSFALAAKACGWRVVGIDKCPATLQLAAQHLDVVSDNVALINEADAVFVAVPMRQYAAVFASAAAHLRADAVMFDGASSKREVIDTAREKMAKRYARFVPSHPVAGDEKNGFSAARAELFNDCLAIICPNDCDDDAAEVVRKLWRDVGARIEEMDAGEHDRVFAAVSHLPHLLSYALAGLLDNKNDNGALLKYAAGGFRDFTRIAGSHSALWTEIFMSNADRLVAAAEDYQKLLGEFIGMVRSGDSAELQKHLENARRLRLRYLAGDKK